MGYYFSSTPVLWTVYYLTGVFSIGSSRSLLGINRFPSSQVSGRLADSRLLGGRNQTARPDAILACGDLRIMISEEKLDLEPKQVSTYLGMTIDTITSRIFPVEREWKYAANRLEVPLDVRITNTYLADCARSHGVAAKLVLEAHLRMRSSSINSCQASGTRTESENISAFSIECCCSCSPKIPTSNSLSVGANRLMQAEHCGNILVAPL